MRFADAMAELEPRQPEHMPEPDLDRIRGLATLLADPQLTYPTIHVTGTNGKTTTARLAAAVACAHGLTTGLFNALVAEVLPGPGSVFLHQEWDYPAPVYIGDTVTAEAKVVEARADKPITRLRCVARTGDGTEVLRGECLVYTMSPDAA